MAKKEKPGKVALKILKALKAHPRGLDIKELRELIPEGKEQQQFDRRLRQLDPFYIIERSRRGRYTVYKYIKPRPEGEWEFEEIDKTLRAKIIHKAAGKCQMCGKTVKEDNIKLHIDHKIPASWGGSADEDNLWAICSICNEGKKNYFGTFDTKTMKKIMNLKSVHERIANLLRINKGQWVDCDLIEFVANSVGSQTEWRKRLRELRYPVIGLSIKSGRRYRGSRAISQYKLTNWVELPPDPTSVVRKYEDDRKKRNKKKQLD